jgi:V/A-type H+/Na+-transporting ATPase subunit I
MAIYKTKELMLAITPDKLDTFLIHIINDAFPIEFLNPTDLGEEWISLEYVKPDLDCELIDLEKLSKLFKFYPENGFWSSFDDSRIELTSGDLRHAMSNRKDLIYIAEKITELKIAQQKLAITIKQNNSEATGKHELEKLQNQIKNIQLETGVDEESIKDVIIPEFKRLYSAIEIEIKSKELPKNIFKTTKDSKTYFAFIAFPEAKEFAINKILIEYGIFCKKISWNKNMVVWDGGNFEPFKQIPQSLGVIGQKELDPTLVVAFFFSFFFALAINDALYGLLIALFTGYVLYFRKIKPALKNIFGLLFISGLFSIITGAFTGSWAGNLFEHTPINNLLTKFQFIKQIPTEKDDHLPVINEILNKYFGGTSPVVALLAFAVFVGIVHILIALSIKAINMYKAKEYHHFITEVSWIGFLLSLMSYFLISATVVKSVFLVSGFILLALVFIFNSGKGVLGKVSKGLIQLYELVAFLADILSYTRLIAIGLTGAIIADVINLLAHLIYDASPSPIAPVLFTIVLTVGHSFNLVVGLFGAYINPLRLHYVEFLPKFYKGKSRQLKIINTNLTYGTIKI